MQTIIAILVSLSISYCSSTSMIGSDDHGTRVSIFELPDSTHRKASLLDMIYRLDIVECPRAIPIKQNIAMYKSYMYFWRGRIICCAILKETKRIIQEEENEVTFELGPGYDRGMVYQFQYTCPNGGGRVVELESNLPSKVDIGDTEVCQSYLNFTFNNISNKCEICGVNNYDTQPKGKNNCLTPLFSDIVITFRSGHSSSLDSKFRVKIKCYEPGAVIQDTAECLNLDNDFTTSQFFKILDSQIDSDMVESIPRDAEQVLVQFYQKYASVNVQPPTEKDHSKIHKLALLSEQSCNESLSALAKGVLSLYTN